MNNQPNQPNKQNQGSKSAKILKLVLLLVIIIALIALTINYINQMKKGEKITQTQFETLVAEDGISGVYVQGGTVRVLATSSQIPTTNFPDFSDYYFTYSTTEEVMWIKTIISAYNASNLVDAPDISFESKISGESLLSRLLPYVSIICVVVISILIFRSFAGGNKGAFSFGKSRTKLGEKSKVKFDDVAGAIEEKAELEEVVDFLKNPERYKKLGARIPKGILLVGPPGTGKTLLAKAVAGEINIPFFSVSGSDFVEMFVGVGASRVRDLFDTAKKNAPCIVFIDEIDAVGRKRGSGLGGGNDEKEQTLNQLLVEMDGFEANEGIIVLAATNRADVLDSALLRPGRFDRQVFVAPPDVKGRESIIKIHARNKPLADSVNYKTLARLTTGFTGADIENMLNEAALLAARAGRNQIVMSDITEGINKAMMGPQKKSRVMTENDRKITAYHESGHAILGKKLKYCDNVQEVSIIPRGMAGGYTLSRPDSDDGYTTQNKLQDEIAMTMGGRLAEEIIFGDVTTGASSDIQHATRLARKMVTEFGMSEKLGFVGLEGANNELFLGRDYQNVKTYSEDKAKDIDVEIKEILDKNYKRAKKILQENKSVLEEMTKLLLEKNTIYTEEVDKLMAGEKAEKISKDMAEAERKQQEEEQRIKKEAEKLEAQNIDNEKVRHAISLAKAGIISEEELNKILKDFESASKNETAKETTAKETTLKNTQSEIATTSQIKTEDEKKLAEVSEKPKAPKIKVVRDVAPQSEIPSTAPKKRGRPKKSEIDTQTEQTTITKSKPKK